MKALLVPIGNSRGVRIPKPLIEQCGLTDEVDLDVQDGTILIRAPRVRPRAGWTKAFARKAREGEDDPLHGVRAGMGRKALAYDGQRLIGGVRVQLVIGARRQAGRFVGPVADPQIHGHEARQQGQVGEPPGLLAPGGRR